MNLLFPIKKKIIEKELRKNATAKSFDETAAEEYELPSDASSTINNSYYFSAVAAQKALFLRLGFRNGLPTEMWVAFRDDNKFYQDLHENVSGEVPLTIRRISNAKKYAFYYRGTVYENQTKSLHSLVIDGTFVATGAIFDFTTGASPKAMAKAIAGQHWSQNFFASLKKNSQVHYEQRGDISFSICIDGKQETYFMHGIRDHSYGVRDWNEMNNHFWLLAIKESGEVFNISYVSYPLIKRLYAGYTGDKKFVSLESLALPQFDSTLNGRGPDKGDMTAIMEDKVRYKIQYRREGFFPFSFANGNYRFYEGFGAFSINDEQAYGIIEFGFNREKNRWIK